MSAYFPDDAAIEAMAKGLLDHSLPKSEWTHAAHFAAALRLIRARGLDAVRADLPSIIRSYNAAVGGVNSDTEGYHETITQASLTAAASLLEEQSPDAPLHQVLDALMAGPLGQRDWMLSYWSREQLFSVAARRGWVEPDLRPLDM